MKMKKSDTKVTPSAKRAEKSAIKAKTLKEESSLQAVGALRAAGWTYTKISKQLKISVATAKRWAKEYKQKNIESKTPIERDETAIRNEELTTKSWVAVKDALKATRLYGRDAKSHPDHSVRLTAAIRVLNSQGELISKEDKSINIVNVVNIENTRKEKLGRGLKLFGYKIPENVISDN
jgi:hypothetical protein